MKASEGDVTFNDLHQIDSTRTINTEITGLSSYTTTDTKTVSGEAIGSTVKAGGNVQIDASKNVVMEGGSIKANGGTINAAENVEIKTSENVSVEEHTTQSRQFIAEAGISGAGKSASASYGKNEGTTKIPPLATTPAQAVILKPPRLVPNRAAHRSPILQVSGWVWKTLPIPCRPRASRTPTRPLISPIPAP